MRIVAIDVSHWHSAYDASYLRVLGDLRCDIVGVSDRDEGIAKARAERTRQHAVYRLPPDDRDDATGIRRRPRSSFDRNSVGDRQCLRQVSFSGVH